MNELLAIPRDNPRHGFFVPFYVHLLEQRGDPRHPEYDFDRRELVYRDVQGKEIKRLGLWRIDGDANPALLVSSGTAIRPREHVSKKAYASSR